MYENGTPQIKKKIFLRDILSTHPDQILLKDTHFYKSVTGWANLELYQYPNHKCCKEEQIEPQYFVTLWGVAVTKPEFHQYLNIGSAKRRFSEITKRLEDEGFKGVVTI